MANLQMRNLLVVLIVLSASVSLAQSASKPIGLSVGDQYRIAFVTDATTDATSSDIDYYNEFVTLATQIPGSLLSELDTEWRAIGSTASIDARDNTRTNPDATDLSVPIYRPDGLSLIADGNASLWSGATMSTPLENAVGSNQYGEAPTVASFAWTGSDLNGVAFRDSSGPEISAALGDSSVARGRWLTNNNAWITSSYIANIMQLHLYGLSGVLTVVPEPSTAIIAYVLGIFGFVLRRSD